MEGFQPGDFQYYYRFKVFPPAGQYPWLEFDLYYEPSQPNSLKGKFCDASGNVRTFMGTN